MKTILIILLLMLSYNITYSQRVFKTNNKSESDVIIKVVEDEKTADVKIYEAVRRAEARGNKGIWYFEQKEKKAHKKIFFSQDENIADIKIFFVDKKYKSGWVNNNKRYLMY
jgi:hypothetical protein